MNLLGRFFLALLIVTTNNASRPSIHTYPMLEKRRIQILVETIFEFNGTRFPIHFVSEFDFRAGHQQLLFVCCLNVDVNDSLIVVANVETLVCVDVILFVLLFAHLAPYRQAVDVHLIPVVIFDGIRKCSHPFFVQFDHADFGRANVICENKNVIITPNVHTGYA